MIKVLVVDDHPLLCSALKDLLGKQRNFEVIAEARDGEEAVKLVNELIPDVVIMDIGMPRLNGFEATRQIKTSHPGIIVLVLTVYTDIEHVFGILRAGADGYLAKTADAEEVVHSINALVAGETVLSPEVSKEIFKYAFQHMPKTVHIDDGDKLLARELEILRFLAKGSSNKDIALSLGLSQRTVKSYLADIFLKLRVGSRTEAVAVCLRKGILTIHDLG